MNLLKQIKCMIARPDPIAQIKANRLEVGGLNLVMES